MATVELRKLSKKFGPVEAIKGVDLTIPDREFVGLLGPSGCGKSTLLRMIAGLEEATDGDILIDGQRVNDVPSDRRGLAMVFQSYALYPHMTAADNMGFALRLARVSPPQRVSKIEIASRILRIDNLLSRKPRELSGGQRQRVAIGRAIVREPRVFLFDEPLSNLDAALRGQMRIELANLHQRLRTTMIFVTHDQVEAMTLADRVVVLNAGRIEQIGAPLELYFQPRNLFVAGFIGSPRINLLEAIVRSASAFDLQATLADGAALSIPVQPGRLREDNRVTIGVRPENFALSEDGPISGRVTIVERLGQETIVYVDLGSSGTITARCAGDQVVRVGDQTRLSVADPRRILLFGTDGAALRPSNDVTNSST